MSKNSNRVFVCVGFGDSKSWSNMDKSISSHEKKGNVVQDNAKEDKNSLENIVGRKKIPAYLQKPYYH